MSKLARAVQVNVPKLTRPEEPPHMKEFGGSNLDAFNETVLSQTLQTAWLAPSTDVQMATDAMCAALIGGKPRDELEGMLIAQMVATHNAAMECFRRSMLSEQTHVGRETNLGHASKMVRSYATLLQALDKHRGKGKQTVRVEHVHVHAGGQAIVGPVSHPGIAQSEETPIQRELERLGEVLAGQGEEGE